MRIDVGIGVRTSPGEAGEPLSGLRRRRIRPAGGMDTRIGGAGGDGRERRRVAAFSAKGLSLCGGEGWAWPVAGTPAVLAGARPASRGTLLPFPRTLPRRDAAVAGVFQS